MTSDRVRVVPSLVLGNQIFVPVPAGGHLFKIFRPPWSIWFSLKKTSKLPGVKKAVVKGEVKRGKGVGERTGPEGEKGGKNEGKRVGGKGPKAHSKNSDFGIPV